MRVTLTIMKRRGGMKGKEKECVRERESAWKFMKLQNTSTQISRSSAVLYLVTHATT